MLLCEVLKKFSTHTMKNDADREKLTLFQQQRQTTAAKLPQVQKIGKNPKTKTTLDCCQEYNIT